MKLKTIILILITMMLVLSCKALTTNQPKNKETYFVKKLTFPENINSEEKIKMAAHLVPNHQQYQWQQQELTAFIHFGINTFTEKEWGDGKENPQIFNPTNLDPEQWVKILKKSGFKTLILTAKHHDGFCLWPTKTTKHSVKNSNWKNGKGDVVKEVKNACDKYKIKFGIYLSPWDRNAPSYGDTNKYNDLYTAQLTELLTQYGEIYEVWFDGANGEGPNGKIQKYDWERFYKIINQYQPNAVKAIMGDDVRWVGNEKGLGRETEWSVTPLNPNIEENSQKPKLSETSPDLGSRTLIEQSKTLYWYPSEVDVSIRPGWFYHKEEDLKVKSLKELVNIYYQSVGMNSVLLLNIPPDKTGRINTADEKRLYEFGNYINELFAENLLTNPKENFTLENNAEIEFNTKGKIVNTVQIQEDITKGQRIESFEIYGYYNNQWKKITEGTTIGYKRILKFESCNPSKIKLKIINTRAIANLKSVGLYFAPKL